MKNARIWASLHPFYEHGVVLGRVEANQGFLKALLQRDPFDAYHFFLPQSEACSTLREDLQKNFPDLMQAGRFSLRLHSEVPAALAELDYYCMHLSDPFARYVDAMCMRNAFSRRIFPLTAPTHSLSYAEYGQEFLQHIWGGTTKRDAVVATSRAGLQVTRNYYNLLRRNYRLEENEFPSPLLRHIPLGIEPSDMPSSAEEKAELGAVCRRERGLGETLVLLVFARISYHSKMDLLPLLRALKRAEEYGLKPGSYCLLLAGGLDSRDSFGEDVKKFAANLGIKCVLAPNPECAERKSLYAAADVFLSPADNLQETFGLTLLEAAISGLPVIASDFNGYKDLVLDGQTGFLTPTIGPADTAGTDALRAMTSSGEYHLRLSQQCVVEVDALGRAIAGLADNTTLRRAMGRAGRERALASFTWKRVIERYLELWAELDETPCPLPAEPLKRPPNALFHPAGPRYMEIFGDYFTRRADEAFSSGRSLRWTRAGEAVYRGRDFPVIYRMVKDEVDVERLKRLLFMTRNPTDPAELRASLHGMQAKAAPGDQDFLLLWALKHDLLEFVQD
ncbi:MAG: glycosyltransferase family 4 protein [Deltaproteobacteria bacterium]|jgi:glycosyltransferase involved in cell wall biosynthesis|nr:glycosyltransferase family 4 protein [Deltaproteobacteria bacterium]